MIVCITQSSYISNTIVIANRILSYNESNTIVILQILLSYYNSNDANSTTYILSYYDSNSNAIVHIKLS